MGTTINQINQEKGDRCRSTKLLRRYKVKLVNIMVIGATRAVRSNTGRFVHFFDFFFIIMNKNTKLLFCKICGSNFHHQRHLKYIHLKSLFIVYLTNH